MIMDTLVPLRACITGEYNVRKHIIHYMLRNKCMHKQCIPGVPPPPEPLGTRLGSSMHGVNLRLWSFTSLIPRPLPAFQRSSEKQERLVLRWHESEVSPGCAWQWILFLGLSDVISSHIQSLEVRFNNIVRSINKSGSYQWNHLTSWLRWSQPLHTRPSRFSSYSFTSLPVKFKQVSFLSY